MDRSGMSRKSRNIFFGTLTPISEHELRAEPLKTIDWNPFGEVQTLRTKEVDILSLRL